MSAKAKTLAYLTCALVAFGCHAQHAEFTVTEYERYAEPWALEFLPDGRLLISEMAGTLKLRSADGTIGEITGLPKVDHGGQGGFGDEIGRAHV